MCDVCCVLCVMWCVSVMCDVWCVMVWCVDVWCVMCVAWCVLCDVCCVMCDVLDLESLDPRYRLHWSVVGNRVINKDTVQWSVYMLYVKIVDYSGLTMFKVYRAPLHRPTVYCLCNLGQLIIIRVRPTDDDQYWLLIIFDHLKDAYNEYMITWRTPRP